MFDLLETGRLISNHYDFVAIDHCTVDWLTSRIYVLSSTEVSKAGSFHVRTVSVFLLFDYYTVNMYTVDGESFFNTVLSKSKQMRFPYFSTTVNTESTALTLSKTKVCCL